MEVNKNADDNIALSNRETKLAVCSLRDRDKPSKPKYAADGFKRFAQYTISGSMWRNNGLGERANSPTKISFSIHKTKTTNTMEKENDHIYMRCL